MANTYDLIYAVVRQIPYGQVATYGQVAELAGLIGKPRVVGYALYRVTDAEQIPWHRVINAKGEVSRSPHRNGTDDLQQVLLEAEGIKFNKSGKIDLKHYRWIADSDLLEAAIARVHQSQLVDSVDEN
ncbi:MAG: MGMT family protein [Cyanobacteria bacterium P01_H01_bin.153]